MGTTNLNTARTGLACSLIRSDLKYSAPRPEQATPPRVHASTGRSAPHGGAKARTEMRLTMCRGSRFKFGSTTALYAVHRPATAGPRFSRHHPPDSICFKA
jgi:hypothetical protein